MKYFILAILFFQSAIAYATGADAAFESLRIVQKVPKGDVLNVRAMPNSDAKIVGSLENETFLTFLGVEKINGKDVWLKICILQNNERECKINGWVNSKFIRPIVIKFVIGSYVPVSGYCAINDTEANSFNGKVIPWSFRTNNADIMGNNDTLYPELKNHLEFVLKTNTGRMRANISLTTNDNLAHLTFSQLEHHRNQENSYTAECFPDKASYIVKH